MEADGGVEALDSQLASNNGDGEVRSVGSGHGQVILDPGRDVKGDDYSVFRAGNEFRMMRQWMDLRIY